MRSMVPELPRSTTNNLITTSAMKQAPAIHTVRRALRAPLQIGAGTALVLALGLSVRALPWPVATALVVGGVLLAVGARRERRPVAGFATRLADLR